MTFLEALEGAEHGTRLRPKAWRRSGFAVVVDRGRLLLDLPAGHATWEPKVADLSAPWEEVSLSTIHAERTVLGV